VGVRCVYNNTVTHEREKLQLRAKATSASIPGWNCGNPDPFPGT